MPRVRIEDLQAGMALGEDVLDGNGQIMMKAGTELSDRDLRRFRMWGIVEVGVAGENGEDGGGGIPPAIDPAVLAECEPLAQQLFSHTNLAHPLMALLYDECIHRLARERQDTSNGRS